MLGLVPVGRRTLFEDRRRGALALLGIGGGLLLVLLMTALFAGFTSQETAYLDRSPASVLVSQDGVRTMQLSTSALGDDVAERAAAVPGVAWVEPLRHMTTTVSAGPDQHLISYVFGFDPTSGRGGPQELRSGEMPGPGEVLIDRGGAQQLGVGVGDRLDVLGAQLVITGITDGLTSLANTTVFITTEQYAELAGEGTSYLLVGAEPGTDDEALAVRVSAALPETTVQSRSAFIDQEAALVDDMYTDVIRTMHAVGLIIALALVALTLSSVTAANLRAYGVVQALGASRLRLVGVVAAQAAWAVAGATAVAAATVVVLAQVVAATVPNVVLIVEPSAVASTLGAALLVGAPAALLPLRRVLRIDPATAFRGAA